MYGVCTFCAFRWACWKADFWVSDHLFFITSLCQFTYLFIYSIFTLKGLESNFCSTLKSLESNVCSIKLPEIEWICLFLSTSAWPLFHIAAQLPQSFHGSWCLFRSMKQKQLEYCRWNKSTSRASFPMIR